MATKTTKHQPVTKSDRDLEATWTVQTTTNNQVDPKDHNPSPTFSLPVAEYSSAALRVTDIEQRPGRAC